MRKALRQKRGLWSALVALAIAALFLALNRRAYDGYFQDDELDNLTWAPATDAATYLRGLVTPAFLRDNFRPVGHLYFTLMGRAFGLNFAPWVTPLFTIHFINGALLFLILRRFSVSVWHGLTVVAFFLLSAAAVNAYWKPMYVFDLLCTAFCLACLLAYLHRKWVLSFLAFWLAYKAKELAVMLPAVLVVYEYWLGKPEGRIRYLRLIPFLLVSLSFGIQGLIFNPNRDNEYTFRFNAAALAQTVPFYFSRLLSVPRLGFLLPLLVLLRDRRIWFALAALLLFMVPLLFLPGRLYQAYLYLPLACASLALGAAMSHVRAHWAVVALLLWLPFDLRILRRDTRAILNADDRNFAFVDAIMQWGARHPAPDVLIFNGVPAGFHDWGVDAAWIIAHRRQPVRAWYEHSAAGQQALANRTVVFGSWEEDRLTLRYR